MSRSAYLFRMFDDDLERLNTLAPRFGGKREALSAALLALAREQNEKDAVSGTARTSLLARIEVLEQRVAALETAPRKRSRGAPRTRQSDS